MDSRLVRFWKIEATDETGQEFLEIFVGASEGPFRFAPGEVETGAYFPVDQIKRWLELSPEDFTPVFRMIARKFLNETKSLIKMIDVS